MSTTIEIEGLDKLVAKLDKLNRRDYMHGLMQAAASDVKDWIAEYPRHTEANMPGPYPKRWYERGYGPRWAHKGGGIGGRQTSETLGRKWATRVDADGMGAVVGNTASYAPYVQDERKQARFHGARGWRTVQGAVQSLGAQIADKVRRGIQRVLEM